MCVLAIARMPFPRDFALERFASSPVRRLQYLAFSPNCDGMLAQNGRVDAPTLAAAERLRASGRKVVMVTSRELSDPAAKLERAWAILRSFPAIAAPLICPQSGAFALAGVCYVSWRAYAAVLARQRFAALPEDSRCLPAEY